MAPKKASNSNKTTKKAAKLPYRHSDDYLNLHTMKLQPVSIEWLEILAKDLVEWAINDEKALKLTAFYTNRGICSDTLARWLRRSKILNTSHKFAKMVIGNRREVGALTKKFDATLVMRSMAVYDKEWKDLEEWRSDLKNKEEEQKAASFVVKMQSFSEKKDEKDAKKPTKSD